MARIGVAVLLLVFAPIVSADDKDKDKAKEKPPTKPSMIGVQIARGATESTILVQGVITNSPAEKGGIKPGDVLLRINDVKPTSLLNAVTVIRSLKPGEKVKFVVKREGKEKTLEIVPMAPGG